MLIIYYYMVKRYFRTLGEIFGGFIEGSGNF